MRAQVGGGGEYAIETYGRDTGLITCVYIISAFQPTVSPTDFSIDALKHGGETKPAGEQSGDHSRPHDFRNKINMGFVENVVGGRERVYRELSQMWRRPRAKVKG
jgi:hypothetical protein